MWYCLFILFCMAVIAAVNIVVSVPIFGFDAFYVVVAVIIYVVVVIAVDGIAAFTVRYLLPKKWFDIEKSHFCASKKESRFYEKIGIKKWKDKVLELGQFTGFRKNKISAPKDNEFIGRYIVEANYGVGVHIGCIVSGFSIMAFYPPYWLCFGLPVAVVNAFINFLSYAILRYNLPKLHVVYKFNQRKSMQRQSA